MVVNVGPTRGSDQHGGEDAWGPVLQSGRPQPVCCWYFPPPGATNPMDRIATLVAIGRKCVWIPHLGRHPDAPSGCCNTLWGLGPAGRGTVTNSNLTMGALDKDPNVVTARDGTWVCVCSVLVWGTGHAWTWHDRLLFGQGSWGHAGLSTRRCGTFPSPMGYPQSPFSPRKVPFPQLILHKLSETR